jgi:F-type H+-transporting ATPase subunit delta
LIRDRGVAARYAAALFAAALKAGEEEQVLADMGAMSALNARDRALQEFLEAPDVLTERKVELIHRLFDARVAPLTVRFLLLMLEKKRIQHFPLTLSHYRQMVEDHQGIVRTRVITAVPLPSELADALRGKLEKLSGKKIRLDPQVDPDIVGGIIVRLGERTVDASIRHRLGELRTALLAPPVH